MNETQLFGYNQAGTIGQSLNGNTFFESGQDLPGAGDGTLDAEGGGEGVVVQTLESP